MTSIVYDARPLKPATRYMGVSEVILNLLPELEKNYSIRGLSHTFHPGAPENMDTWHSLGLADKFIYEFSPLFTKKFDVYWGTNTFLPGWFLKGQSVVTVHDLILFDMPGDQRASGYFQNRFVSSIKRAGAIISDSKTSADSLIQKFPFVKNKVEVGLLGYRKVEPVQTLVEKYRNLYPRPFVIFLGAHRPRKKLELAVESVRQVRDGGTALELVVTGGVHQSFDPIIERHRDWIHTPGVLDRGDLTALLSVAQALLFPTSFEGFGLPVLEAMSVDCPVIASDIPIVREISGGVAALLGAQPDNWAKTILKVLSEADYRAELISSGRENLQRFSWEKTAEIYSTAIDRLTG